MARSEHFISHPEKPTSKGQELGTKIFRFVFEKDANSIRSQAFSDFVDLEEAKIKDRQTQHQLTQIKSFTHTDYFASQRKQLTEESSKSFVKKLTLSWEIDEKCAENPEYRNEYQACKKLIEPFINERKWLDTKIAKKSRILREEEALLTTVASIAFLKGIKRK